MKALGVATAVGALAWLGFRVPPRRRRRPPLGVDMGEVPLPADLPAPVARHYRAAGFTGPAVPRVETFALWERARMRCCAASTTTSARLRVPFGAAEDELVFRFDPDTGLIASCRTMRYRTPGQPKVGWRIAYERWTPGEDGGLPRRITVRWEDHERPWFVLDVDGFAANIPVSADLTGAPAQPARRETT